MRYNCWKQGTLAYWAVFDSINLLEELFFSCVNSISRILILLRVYFISYTFGLVLDILNTLILNNLIIVTIEQLTIIFIEQCVFFPL